MSTSDVKVYENVAVEVDGNICTVKMNRPKAVSYTHLTLPTIA